MLLKVATSSSNAVAVTIDEDTTLKNNDEGIVQSIFFEIIEIIEIFHKLSSQFQKFTIVLFFKIFSIGLFYSK